MRRIAFVFLLLCLAACARRMPSGPSWCAAEPPAGTAAIAEDAVALLAATYPPGHTSIHLKPAQAGQDENAFAAALESGLRAKGFRIAAAPGKALTLAYTLDALEENVWYLRLRLSDGKTFARTYSSGGEPEAGRSLGVRP